MSTLVRTKIVSELRTVWNNERKISPQTVNLQTIVVKPALNNTIISQFTRIILPKKVLYKLFTTKRYN